MSQKPALGNRPAASELPFAERDTASMQGHWLLARLGKRVLRPGGIELTHRLLGAVDVTDRHVVEFAPGVGRTAGLITARRPRSYVGVEADPRAAAIVERVVGSSGSVVVAEASATGLPESSADVVIGEAMLTMQSERGKKPIVEEAARVLRPGGRYVVHELALHQDGESAEAGEQIRKALARSLRVNARPLTIAQWRELFAEAGLQVTHVETAPMALLRPRRVVADEGVAGTLRILRNVLRDKDGRRRVLDMAATFRTHRKSLVAVGLVATKPC